MTGGPQIALLPDGRRLHMQHGPIDLIIEAFGPADERRAAYGQAEARFDGLLATLVDELDLLRTPIAEITTDPAGPVAQRMAAACRRHADVFVTPMAAVAGAVADDVLAALIDGRSLTRAYVNDGGDIALHLTPGERFDAGLVGDLARPAIDGVATIDAALPVRGIATSGRAGRSLKPGATSSEGLAPSGSSTSVISIHSRLSSKAWAKRTGSRYGRLGRSVRVRRNPSGVSS